MNTLEIHVSELIRVADVIADTVEYLLRVLINFVKPKSKKAKKAEIADDSDNKSPPDLSVAVKDEINTTERIS
jgi:hypothetical protein